MEETLKILRFLEVLIDGRKADIGNFVDLLQAFHNQFANFIGANIALALAFKLSDNAGDHTFQLVRIDVPFAGGSVDGLGELVPVEQSRFKKPILLQRKITRETPEFEQSELGRNIVLGKSAVKQLQYGLSL